MAETVDTHGRFVDAVVSDIQVAAGAAPFATVEELIDIFTLLADRIPDARTEVDLMVLRRLFANVTRHMYRHAGAALPLRPIVNRVADADDPKAAFKAALAALRPTNRSIRTGAPRSGPCAPRGSLAGAS
jgi:hypothetical protein